MQRAIRDGIVTRRALAKAANIRDTVLIRVLEPNWNPTAETLSALSKALDALGILKKNEPDTAFAL